MNFTRVEKKVYNYRKMDVKREIKMRMLRALNVNKDCGYTCIQFGVINVF